VGNRITQVHLEKWLLKCSLCTVYLDGSVTGWASSVSEAMTVLHCINLIIITSAKEVVFMVVCRLEGLCRNYLTFFNKNRWKVPQEK